jgi:hypothetical protein
VPGLQTEYSFTLPKGYVDAEGRLHRQGTMRLATARDEMEPLRDPRINSADDPFLTIMVLARVVTELGTVPAVTTTVVENLFAADIAFLQDLYGIINFGNPADVEILQQSVLPEAEPDGEHDALDASPPERYEPADDTRSLDQAAPIRRRDRIEEVPTPADR